MVENRYVSATVVDFGIDTGQGYVDYNGRRIAFSMKTAVEGTITEDVKVGEPIYIVLRYGEITAWRSK